jgi:uncharacterized membrane protein
MAGNPLTDPQWAADLADTVEQVVGEVRDRATKPAVKVTRGVVFGLLGAVLGVVALALLLIGATRGLQVVLDTWLSRAQSVYLSYLIMGGILCLLGAFFFHKRHSPEP